MSIVGIVVAILTLIVLMRLWSGRMYRAEKARKQAMINLINTEVDKAIKHNNLH